MTTPGRSAKGVFRRSTKGVLGPLVTGPQVFLRQISARLRLRLEINALLHTVTPVGMSTIILDDWAGSADYYFFNFGLDRLLERMLANSDFAVDCEATLMKDVTEVLRDDNFTLNPGWDPYNSSFGVDNGPFINAQQPTESALGAYKECSGGINLDTDVDGVNIHGVIVYLRSEFNFRAPLLAMVWGSDLTASPGGSRISYSGDLYLEKDTGDVTTEGLAEVLHHGARLSYLPETRFMGLIASGPAASLSSTMSSPPFTELEDYDESFREQVNEPSASEVQDGEHALTLGGATFNFSSGETVTGAFLCTSPIKGSTSLQELFGASLFGSPVNASDGDSLQVSYAVSLFADDAIGAP